MECPKNLVTFGISCLFIFQRLWSFMMVLLLILLKTLWRALKLSENQYYKLRASISMIIIPKRGSILKQGSSIISRILREHPKKGIILKPQGSSPPRSIFTNILLHQILFTIFLNCDRVLEWYCNHLYWHSSLSTLLCGQFCNSST